MSLTHFFHKLRSNEAGQSTVLVAIFLSVLMGASALSVDLGSTYFAKIKIQNAADFAALAAADQLPRKAATISTAEEYADLNGASGDRVIVTTPYDGDPYMVEVVIERYVPYSFGRVLGKEGTTVRARAVARAGPLGGPFRYSIFSGSPTSLMGLYVSNLRVYGSIHGNASMTISCSDMNVTGDVEAVNSANLYNGTTTIGGALTAANWNEDGIIRYNIGTKNQSAAEFIEMPDFSQSLIAQARASSNNGSYTITEDNRSWLVGNTGRRCYLLNGDNIVIDQPIFVDGDLLISASSFTGNGFIIATGSIYFCTGSVRTTGSSVGFYSVNGDIMFSTSYYISDANAAEGLLYAPNGAIKMGIGNFYFKGRLIANEIFISGTLTVESSTTDLQCLPKTKPALVE